MFAKLLEKIKARRIQTKLEARLNDARRYSSGPQPMVLRAGAPIFRDLIDGMDFSVIDPKDRK